MLPRPLPLFIDTHAVYDNPLDWTEVSRDEAIRHDFRGRLVVVSGPTGTATRFDDCSPYWQATGPYNYTVLRYFVHRGFRGAGSTAAPAAPLRKPASNPVEPELVPLEEPEPEPEAKPAKRAASSATKAPEPEKMELRFDLALDPATPGLEDDIFVLSSGDGTYNVSKTLKDDKVPGDKKLTLVFPGVSEGKTYTLSQVQDGEETVLVPEVTYAAGKAAKGPGEVVGCKAVFRECRIKGEKEDFYKEKESEYLIDLAPATGKWVYVFGGPMGKPCRLMAEGVGLSDGTFRPVDLGKYSGKPTRDPMKKSSAWMTLPLLVNGKAWDLYTCLSPFQLSWKRIEQLAAKPQFRCYKIGAREGGILWAPGHLGRDVPDLLNARDPRVKDPGKDALVLGLIDPMAEAKRRADLYQKRVVPYLEHRFDIPPADGQPVPAADRRRKYVAGLLKVLVEQHPGKKNLRAALSGNGLLLDSYLTEQNEREIDLKKKAEKTGAALVKWMDHPSGLFEAALSDYTADPEESDRWQEAKEDFAYLIRYFDVTSLTRLYSRKVVERKDTWVMKSILSKDAHQAARKLNEATVEILSWLGKVLVQRKDFNLKLLEDFFGRFVPGWEFEYRQASTLEHKTLITEYFPDERTPKPPMKLEKYWEAFESPAYRREVEVIRLTQQCRPLEKLAKVADSKVAKSLIFALEGVNIVLAFQADSSQSKMEHRASGLGTTFDAFLVVGESIRIFGKKAGRGFLSALGFLSAGIDLYLALKEARQEHADGDYDAAVAQITVAAGSASLAVGMALVSTSVYSGLTLSSLSLKTLFTLGGSISITGAGAPVGAALILAGVSLVAAGTIAYLLSNDSELETWIKESPFGSLPKWTFSDEATAATKIGKISQQFFPWKVSSTHAFLFGKSEYAISIQGPLNPYSKIKILSLDLLDKHNRKTRFLQDEILRPIEARNIRIATSLETPQSVTLYLKDSACWAAHRQRFPEAENGFTTCLVGIEIDHNGDGLVLWKPDADYNILTFKLKA